MHTQKSVWLFMDDVCMTNVRLVVMTTGLMLRVTVFRDQRDDDRKYKS